MLQSCIINSTSILSFKRCLPNKPQKPVPAALTQYVRQHVIFFVEQTAPMQLRGCLAHIVGAVASETRLPPRFAPRLAFGLACGWQSPTRQDRVRKESSLSNWSGKARHTLSEESPPNTSSPQNTNFSVPSKEMKLTKPAKKARLIDLMSVTHQTKIEIFLGR